MAGAHTTVSLSTTRTDCESQEQATPNSDLTEQDKQVVLELYQTYPQLWQDFKDLTHFCDTVDAAVNSLDNSDRALLHAALKFNGLMRRHPAELLEHVARFAAAVGFAEQAVKVLRPGMGQLRAYSDREERLEPWTACLLILLNMLHNLTHYSDDFRPRLAKTGFFRDIAQCLDCMKHQSAEVLKRSNVCMSFLEVLHNSCKNPGVIPVVKQLDMATTVAAFLHKKPCKDIQVSAILLLAFIVDDGQLDLLEMDHDLLQCCLTGGQTALTSPNPKHGLQVEELVVGWSLLARLDFNRRLMVAKEDVVDLLMEVLTSGTETETEAAAATFQQLAMDAANARIFQRNKRLTEALTAKQNSENHKTRQAVLNTLSKIQEADTEEDDIEENTALFEALAEQLNTLTIFGVGRVEFLLDELSDVTSGGRSNNDVTHLKALREMATEESCRREILARGGLCQLQKLTSTQGQGWYETRVSQASPPDGLLQRTLSCDPGQFRSDADSAEPDTRGRRPITSDRHTRHRYRSSLHNVMTQMAPTNHRPN